MAARIEVRRSALLRTARKLMRGEVFVPGPSVWRRQVTTEIAHVACIGFGEVGQTLADGLSRARDVPHSRRTIFCFTIGRASRVRGARLMCASQDARDAVRWRDSSSAPSQRRRT